MGEMADVPDDAQLLDEFVRKGSQQAFGVLVSRHVDLVYAAALRQVRQTQAAEDVSQTVFALLARKAASLRRETILPAWLLKTTRYACLDLLKSEVRRRRREQKVAAMKSQVVDPAVEHQVLPVLDEALAALGERDRRIVVLRYFAGERDPNAALLMGMTETALRQRRFRALEKLRSYLRRHGIDAPADALVGVMLGVSRLPAPPHLATAATRFAMTSSIGLTIAGVKGVLVMAWLKSNAAVLSLVAILLLGGAGLLIAGHLRGREPMEIAAAPPPVLAPLARPPGFAPGEEIPARAYSDRRGGQDFPGCMGYLDSDVWLKYAHVDFGNDAGRLRASLAVPADHAGKQIIARIDKPNGSVIARLTVKSTGGWGKIEAEDAPLQPVNGVHDVYLSFNGSGVANLYWIKIVPRPIVGSPATRP